MYPVVLVLKSDVTHLGCHSVPWMSFLHAWGCDVSTVKEKACTGHLIPQVVVTFEDESQLDIEKWDRKMVPSLCSAREFFSLFHHLSAV